MKGLIMKLVFLNGGLANQIFQYIFYRYADITHPGEEFFLDDSFFFVHQVHNGYELERVFGLQPKRLSQYFDGEVWQYMMDRKREENVSVPEMLLESGVEIRMVSEASNWNHWNPFSGQRFDIPNDDFYPEILNLPGDIYYHGYWLRPNWLRGGGALLREELRFPSDLDSLNKVYLQRIKESNSVSVHIRRGDYVTGGFAERDGFYFLEIEKMLELEKDMTLFVFSDDIPYCVEHKEELGLTLPKETVFVTGNEGENAFRDMDLMSHCRHMIIGNSAFCYLAALLNENLHRVSNPLNRVL